VLLGYSRATIYKHWPTRNALFVDAFSYRPSGEHHVPTGDLRADLIAELTMFRRGMERQRLDRALAALATLTISVPELAEVRDRLVAGGERVLLQLLTPVAHGTELEAAMRMLSGSVLHSALMHGQLPTDDVIAAVVDLLLRGLKRPTSESRKPFLSEAARSVRYLLRAERCPGPFPAWFSASHHASSRSSGLKAASTRLVAVPEREMAISGTGSEVTRSR
jgi:AcrR family transcriptional regulator